MSLIEATVSIGAFEFMHISD